MWTTIAASLMLVLLGNNHADASRMYKRYVSSDYDGGLSGEGAYGGAYGGAYSGAGAHGFSGGGSGAYGFPSPPFDFPGFPDPFEFQKAFSHYFSSLQKQQAAAASMTYATDDATASASTFLSPSYNLFRHQFNHQNDLLNTIRKKAGTTYGSSGPSYAGASVSYGPNGVYQSTYIDPENPAHPNINMRFSSSGGPGFYGVSSASFSESSNVNGQKTNRRGSVTQVNDNGKVTTYKSHS